MSQPALEIRPPTVEGEAIAAHNLLSLVFGTLPPLHEQAEAARMWLARRAAWAALVPSETRAAFRGGVCLGAYQLDERALLLGGASAPAGCIGAVATHPEHRNQGVASALMADALDQARRRGLGLLLLHGIGGFYHRFGYTSVADAAEHRIALTDVEALPPIAFDVRPATPEDAPALLELYDRHQGCLARSLELQRALLQSRPAERMPVLAIDERGRPCGYLALDARSPWCAAEAGADSWQAAAALLLHHARLARRAGAGSLAWRLSPRGRTYYLLADAIALESVSRSTPGAEWMGRVASAPHLLAALLPAWQAHAAEHPPALRWEIGAEVVGVACEGGALRLAEVAPGAPTVRLSQESLARLALGYRPAAWAAAQPGSAIPQPLARLIERLFAGSHLFVPHSDEF